MTRVSSLAGLALAATVLLTGCGAVPDLTPGVAAKIGDDTVSTGRVRDVAASYCAAVRRQPQSQPVAMSLVNQQVVTSLALREAATRFADEEGVTPDSSYQDTIDKAEAGGEFKGLSAAEKDAVITVAGTQYYLTAVENGAGQDGAARFQKWLADQDVRLDPRYGVTLDGGKAAPADTSLSYAVSDLAKADDGGQQSDAGAVLKLPSSQRCG